MDQIAQSILNNPDEREPDDVEKFSRSDMVLEPWSGS